MRQYLSLEDEILTTGLGPKRAKRLRDKGKIGTRQMARYGRSLP